jgi:hypothetical protein
MLRCFLRIKLLEQVDIQSFGKKTAEIPPKRHRKKVGKTVITTPTEVEVPLETTQRRTVMKTRLRWNSREWPFFVFT